MAIALRGTASNNALNGANVTVTLPAGTAQDDVVYAAYGEGHFADADMAVVTSGYTELADIAAVASFVGQNLGVYRKIQPATPDSTVEFDGHGNGDAGVAGAVMVLDGVDTTTPEDAGTTTATNTAAAVPDPPSITTVTANAWVLAIGATTEADIPTAPANYSDLIEDQGVDVGSPGCIMMARREIASAGAENPGAFGNISGTSDDRWCAATVAVRPAAGGGGITLTADAGSYSITGTAASLEFGREVVAAAGSYAITGQNATLRKTLPLVAGAGSYAITGQAAALEFDREVVAAAGSYAITGFAVALEFNREIVAEAAAYTLGGQDASLELGRALVAGAGQYEIAGTNATLTYTPSGAPSPPSSTGGWSDPPGWRRRKRRDDEEEPQEPERRVEIVGPAPPQPIKARVEPLDLRPGIGADDSFARNLARRARKKRRQQLADEDWLLLH